MKILHINKRYGFEGGIEQYLHWVTDALSRDGHEVWFICAEAPEGAHAAAFVDPARVIRIPGLLDSVAEPVPAAARLLEEAVARIRPDVIYLHHLQNPHFNDVLFARAPVVRFAHMEDVVCPMTEKNFPGTWKPCLYKSGPLTCGVLCPWIHRHGSRHPVHIARRLRFRDALISKHRPVRRWVVASEFMRRSLEREGLSPDSIDLNPYFTDPGPAPVPVPRDSRLIFFSGRLVRTKGVDFLLRAFAKVVGPARLEIAGDGPDQPRLEALARELGVADCVTFLGRVANERLRAYRDRARVIAVPSLFQEPFGIVGIEAMSAGRPVVAHDVGGIPQWLEHGVTGYRVPAMNVDALAARLQEFLDSPELADRMGRAGRSKVEAEFLMSRHMPALYRTFEKAIAKGSPVD